MTSAQFAELIRSMAAAVCRGDGRGAARCFNADGVYHDHFYGEFSGREAIERMVTDYFHRDAERLKWDILDPCSDGTHGYARYAFQYTAKVPGSEGKRIAYTGMLHCQLADGHIAHYAEIFDRGPVLLQLGFPDARILASLRKSPA